MEESIKRLITALSDMTLDIGDGVLCTCDKSGNDPLMKEHTARCIEISDSIKEIREN